MPATLCLRPTISPSLCNPGPKLEYLFHRSFDHTVDFLSSRRIDSADSCQYTVSRELSISVYKIYTNHESVKARQWSIAGFAPGTPFMTDSSSLGARCRLIHDAANTTQQGRYPAHDHAMMSLAATVSTCPIWPALRAHTTSFIKPEVHNLSQCRQRRTEPRPEVTCTPILVKI